MENFISPLRFKKSNYVIRLFSNEKFDNSALKKKNDEKHLLYCIVTAVIVFWPKTPKTTKYNELYSDYNALYSKYNNCTCSHGKRAKYKKCIWQIAKKRRLLAVQLL